MFIKLVAQYGSQSCLAEGVVSPRSVAQIASSRYAQAVGEWLGIEHCHILPESGTAPCASAAEGGEDGQA